MAYEIIGNVHKIGTTVSVPTKSGNAFQRRSVTLIQRRFDQNTGQEFEPNYPTIDFAQRGCEELDRYKPGDRVKIRFDISGVKYNDRSTQEEKYFTTLRGFRIEPYVQQNAPRAQYAPQPPQQYPPQQGGYQPAQPVQEPFPPQVDMGYGDTPF